MACVTCSHDTNDTRWGPWCDVCGGVSFKPGQVFFRHVATVDGPGGRFPIVFDISTGDYAYMFKDLAPPTNKRDEDGFRKSRLRIVHGSLDAVIAMSYNDVKGDGDGSNLELSAAPSSTPQERVILGI